MTAPPGGFAQPAQDIPGWRLWLSATGRWWALQQVALTAAQVTAGCRPLIYAADNPTLVTLIRAQDNLRASCPKKDPPGRHKVRSEWRQ
jgi:hypothetical protein